MSACACACAWLRVGYYNESCDVVAVFEMCFVVY